MKARSIQIYNHFDDGLPFKSTAKISVPGLGDVQIESALSAETCNRVEAEVLAALRVKLKMPLLLAAVQESEAQAA